VIRKSVRKMLEDIELFEAANFASYAITPSQRDSLLWQRMEAPDLSMSRARALLLRYEARATGKLAIPCRRIMTLIRELQALPLLFSMALAISAMHQDLIADVLPTRLAQAFRGDVLLGSREELDVYVLRNADTGVFSRPILRAYLFKLLLDMRVALDPAEWAEALNFAPSYSAAGHRRQPGKEQGGQVTEVGLLTASPGQRCAAQILQSLLGRLVLEHAALQDRLSRPLSRLLASFIQQVRSDLGDLDALILLHPLQTENSRRCQAVQAAFAKVFRF
jgi:hypothetical protein